MSNALKKLAIGLTALTAFNTANADDVQKQTEYKPFSSPISTHIERCDNVPTDQEAARYKELISANPAQPHTDIAELAKQYQKYINCTPLNHLQR